MKWDWRTIHQVVTMAAKYDDVGEFEDTEIALLQKEKPPRITILFVGLRPHRFQFATTSSRRRHGQHSFYNVLKVETRATIKEQRELKVRPTCIAHKQATIAAPRTRE